MRTRGKPFIFSNVAGNRTRLSRENAHFPDPLGGVVRPEEIYALGRGGAVALLEMLGGDFPIESQIPKEVESKGASRDGRRHPDGSKTALRGRTAREGTSSEGRSRPGPTWSRDLNPLMGHSGAPRRKEPPRSKSH